MPDTPTYDDNARAALVRVVREGQTPNGISPDDCGPWAQVVRAVYEAHASGGADAARAAYDTAVRMDKGGGVAALLATLVNGAPEPWEPPLPLGRATEVLPAFPTEALPSWLRAYVEAVATSMVAPPDMAALFGLGVIAAACQRRTRVQVKDDWVEPLCLYTFVVMPVGSKKTPIYNKMVKPVQDYERAEVVLLKAQVEHDEYQVKVLEGRVKEAQTLAVKAKSAQQRQEAAQEIQEAAREKACFRPTVEPRYLCGDTTAEKLIDLMARHNGRMFLASDEAGIFATLGGRYNEGVENLDGVLQAHTEQDITQDRITRASVRVDRAALSIAVAGQPSVLQSLGANPAFKTRGLLARIIYSVPTVMVGGDDYPLDPPQVPPHVAATYTRNIVALFARAARAQNEQGDDIADTLTLSDSARVTLNTYRAVVRSGMVEGRAYDDGGFGWTAKLEGQVVRFAALLHMAEHGPQGVDLSIAAHSIAAAIQIGEYGYAHARAAFGLIGDDPRVEAAKRVWRAIEKDGRLVISKSDIWQNLRRSFSLDDLDEPLDLLVRHGYLRKPPPPPSNPNGGRKRSPAYEVNPLPCTYNPQNTHNSPVSGGATFNPASSTYSTYSTYTPDTLETPDAAPVAPDTVAPEVLAQADALRPARATVTPPTPVTEPTDEAVKAYAATLPYEITELRALAEAAGCRKRVHLVVWNGGAKGDARLPFARAILAHRNETGTEARPVQTHN